MGADAGAAEAWMSVAGEPGLVVRRADGGDRAALEAMFQRCSPTTVYRRFHGHVRTFPRAYLDEALASGSVHWAVVCLSGADAVALASCRAGDLGTAELGILIEDAWQRRGLGGLLLGQLVAHADAAGIGDLHAQVLTEQDWIIGMLARHGSWASAFRHGVREVTLHRDASLPVPSVRPLPSLPPGAAAGAHRRGRRCPGRRRGRRWGLADAGPAEFW